jgi:hypothetical protein
MPLVILQQTNKKNWLIEETRSKTFMTRSNSATFSWLASFVSLRICEEYYITCDESNKANRIIIVSFWKKKRNEMKSIRGWSALFREQKYRKIVPVRHDTRTLLPCCSLYLYWITLMSHEPQPNIYPMIILKILFLFVLI